MIIDLKLHSPQEIKQNIGTDIKGCRKQKKIGTKRLSKQLNIAENTLIKIEGGEGNYTIDNLLLILKSLQ